MLNVLLFFFFNDTATTEIYTLSLHDALPIWSQGRNSCVRVFRHRGRFLPAQPHRPSSTPRSEEHTSELQSRQYLVCRLLLEKKKKKAKRLHAYLTTHFFDNKNTHYFLACCVG